MAKFTGNCVSAKDKLEDRLAEVLPKDKTFRIFHISTPPNNTEAIYSAPPNVRPDKTYCESHFLAVSIDTVVEGAKSDVLVFAIEVLLYSTAFMTTFFVSKADSTGYLHHLKLPKGAPSSIRVVSSVLLEYLVEKHQRPGIRNILSLFARAQDQYLFPGSVENEDKHVLDDRGLVKWWCKVLDPLIGKHSKNVESSIEKATEWEKVRGFLIVPGSDNSLSFLPPTSRDQWTIGDPLREISHYAYDAPPSCLIPHFPDDPKARFLDELDDELAKSKDGSNTGQWKSVKTLAQFWEAMEFRQECSAGRLVGFIWVIFSPVESHFLIDEDMGESQNAMASAVTDVTGVSNILSPTRFRHQDSPPSSPLKFDEDGAPSNSQQSTMSRASTTSKKRKLRGTIVPRQPRAKTHNKRHIFEEPENTSYYTWPADSRGQIVLSEKDYKRATELLLRLDFANLEIACGSTQRWVEEVQMGASESEIEAFGALVKGEKAVEVQSLSAAAGVQTLNVGLVRKKRKPGVEEPSTNGHEGPASSSVPTVNVLGSGMVRKKPKI